MVLDISGLNYFMPVYGFLFVFLIVFAVLAKTKILGENKFINLIVSIIIGVIFLTMSSVQDYVQMITPWFAVLIICLFFVMLLIGLSMGKMESIMKPGFAWVFIGALLIVFVVSAIKVFSPFNSVWAAIISFINVQTRIAGTIIFILIAGLVAWVITKK